MRGGHNRKPSKLKIIEGTARRDRMKNEPKPKPTIPGCPKWLPVDAKREWRRLVDELGSIKLLARIDRDALADLCLCIVRLRQAEKDIEKRGLVIQGRNDEAKRNPSVLNAKEYRAALRAWGERFGLTPADRGRLSIDPHPGLSVRERILLSLRERKTEDEGLPTT